MQSLQSIPERFFSNGMNNNDKPEFLKEGQCVVAKNVLLANEEIAKGPGSVASFDLGWGHPCLGAIATDTEVYAAFSEPGNHYAFIYRWTGSGTPVVVGSTNLTVDTPVNFVDTGDAVYVFNGIDATGKLVGAAYTTPAGMPIGRFGAWVNNRLYVARASDLNRIDYSDVNAPETFGGSSNILIFPNDRSYITGLASFNGTLVITKIDNTLTFDGFTEDDFTIKRVKDQLGNIGNTSYRSLVNTGDDLLFMSFAGFIPHIRSLRRTQFQTFSDGGIISKDIEDTMKTINKSRLDQIAGGFDGRFAWWSIPTGSSVRNDLTICKDMTKEGSKGWTIHENLNANVFFKTDLSGTDRFYFGSADLESKILYLDQNVGSRDGADIEIDYQSRVYRPDTARKSKFKYLYTKTGSDVVSTIDINASPDGFTYEMQDQFSSTTLSGGFPYTFPFYFGSTSDRRHRTTFTTPQANAMQIEYVESSDRLVSIKEYELFYYERGLRDV